MGYISILKERPYFLLEIQSIIIIGSILFILFGFLLGYSIVKIKNHKKSANKLLTSLFIFIALLLIIDGGVVLNNKLNKPQHTIILERALSSNNASICDLSKAKIDCYLTFAVKTCKKDVCNMTENMNNHCLELINQNCNR
jgi:hypothetical protein